MKKIVVITMIVLTTLFITGCGCNNKKEEKKTPENQNESLNTRKGIISDQTVDGVKFTNAILLLNGEGMSDFKITLVNETSQPKAIETFKVTFKGQDGNILLETYGYVGYELKSKESAEVKVSLDQDMKDAYEVKYEFIK